MIEKELEKYINASFCREKAGIEEITIEDLKQAFSDGYDKANEWHFLKDGVQPRKNQLVLLYRENPNGANIALTYWYESYANDKVIAWKAVELPKEIE